mmetsp:Transcript_27056/g.45455  ORF Transcript_27056/g.45455 Transcript_27056/m.45455 type:complete len:182 (+) Transcript_27056:277-822(+)
MDKSHFANSLHRKKEGECEKKSTVRLISWNVNGLRAILKRLSMKNVLELIRSLERCGLPSSSLSSSSSSSSSSENHRFSLSLACFQETKLTVAELIESLVRRSNIIIIIIIISFDGRVFLLLMMQRYRSHLRRAPQDTMLTFLCAKGGKQMATLGLLHIPEPLLLLPKKELRGFLFQHPLS